ncbi:MAG: hypothetical protein IKF64_00205 [Eubacterium sp.]|nr:hypothetical protein [Eubacterium sp.]
MKYFLRVLFTLVLAVAVVFGVYYYTNGNPFEQTGSNEILTTASQAPATEKNSNRELIASLPKQGYYLYKGSKGAILVHNKKEFEFNNWSKLIDVEEPKMYLTDFDGDGSKELLIRVVATKNETTGELLYEVYMLKSKTDENGEEAFDVFAANQATWEEIVNNQIRIEIGQLKSCKKFIQVSMNNKSETINYDEETGIAADGFSGYARALQEKGSYCTFQSWSKGRGVYTVNKKKEICIAVDVNVQYSETESLQTIGHINFKLDFKDGKFIVKNQTMNFAADKAYKISDPRSTSAEAWNYTETNTDASLDGADKIIDWIKYKPQYSADIATQMLSFDEEQTDIRSISKIYMTNSFIELTAKNGFTFAEQNVENGDYSIVINRGSDNEYDIAYTAKILEVNGTQVLRISFDKSYAQSEVHAVEINFGAK